MSLYPKAIILLALLLGTSAPAGAEDKLSSIFDPEMLNAQVAYLESLAGPAMHTNSLGPIQVRDYRVAGCKVTAYVKGSAVLSYALDLTSKCNFDLGKFLGNGYPTTRSLTIGKFARGIFGPSLSVNSSCIYMCGNAADPTVDFTFEGPHAVNFVNVVLTVILATDVALKAEQRWETTMRRHENENYIMDTRFNCDQKYSGEAVRAFSDVPVARIAVGSFIPSAEPYQENCKRK